MPAYLADLTGMPPIALLAIGALGMFVAMSILRLLRTVRRMLWTAAMLTAASGMGAGGGWMVLDALRLWR